MAVPKGKISKSRRGQRRSQKSLTGTNVVENSTTGELHRPHHVSPDGYYRNRQVTSATVRN
ncbi:MAG: 50S ribosomal protein L32 [Rickettsiales bacterium]|nr:50S ribosomal protein L32 [Rickettsiales bacterium]